MYYWKELPRVYQGYLICLLISYVQHSTWAFNYGEGRVYKQGIANKKF